ncbi:ATP-binding protein [Sulfurimonas sp. MAG313]|nr:ATP-binding protein [Sulfurimonas sp. MAG313]MDF1880305.1 ATP-binding protein [Sulfurimonas sp. MAG313]
MLFQYGKPVTGTLFYDRKILRDTTKDFITLEQSFMLKAPRRFGKTSLIKQVFDERKQEYFYADLRKLPRLEKFSEKIIDYAYEKAGIFGFVKQVKKNAIAFLREHKTNIKINLEILEFSAELFSRNDVSECEKLVHALDTLNEVGIKLDKTLYMVLDEFQEVKKHKCDNDILEVMRGTMQHHDRVVYVFLGSYPTLMTEIFENKKSAFFNFCRKISLEPFEEEVLEKELSKAFSSKGIVFDNKKILRSLIKRTNGHPANTILVMQNIERQALHLDVKLIKEEVALEAYENAAWEVNDLIEEYISEIKQKEHLYDVIYRLANGEKQVLQSRSLYQKYTSLERMGFIQKVGRGKYRVIDGFLEESLRASW